MGNQKNDRQQTALALAVLAYAENIANPGVLLPVIDRIGHKHTSLDIRPKHYSIVGKHLLASIQEVLGETATRPSAFIQKQYKDLVAAGANKGRIYFEEFGPQVLALN